MVCSEMALIDVAHLLTGFVYLLLIDFNELDSILRALRAALSQLAVVTGVDLQLYEVIIVVQIFHHLAPHNFYLEALLHSRL